MEQDREHQQIVDAFQRGLQKLGAGLRRPHMVSNELYRPDACVTLDGEKFIPVEVINTNYGFDILGMLSLVMCKDIIDCGVCIVTDKLYLQDPTKFEAVIRQVKKFQKYSDKTYGNNLVILREKQAIPWFKERVKNLNLWKPEELIHE